ncbi:MAG TPA: ATP-binding protein [Bryobacteraceae bacterium]|nr:ATP-binding protein [Bryobacteraceae bacterium]
MPFEKASFPRNAANRSDEDAWPRGHRSGAPRLGATRNILALGFGVLLILLALSGFSALHALSELQDSNETTLREFLAENQQLDELRTNIYLSGTYVRDYLLEPDRDKAEESRKLLLEASSSIDALLSDNGPLSRAGDRHMFEALKREMHDYWNTLEPVLSWNADQRRQQGYRFLRDEVFPRRSNTLNIADTIQSVNQQQLMRRDASLLAKFSSVRSQLMLAVLVMLAFGAGLAFLLAARLLRLERQTLAHLREVSEAREELRDLSARLVATQENERKSISRDLHDAVGQSMSAVQFELHDLAVALRPHDPQLRARVDRIRELVESSLSVIRNMALLLRPSMLDDLGLAAALEWLAREISRPTGVRIHVRAEGLPEELPDEHKTCIFRIAQEALNNVCKHANAHSVDIAVRASDSWLTITVRDDGRGFQHPRAGGLGLKGMRERVEGLGGSLNVTSALGEGTSVEARLPLPRRAPLAEPEDAVTRAPAPRETTPLNRA